MLVKSPISAFANVKSQGGLKHFTPIWGTSHEMLRKPNQALMVTNGGVWALTHVLHKNLAHASNQTCPKMSCHMHLVHYTHQPIDHAKLLS